MNILQRHRMKNFVRVAYRGGQWSENPPSKDSCAATLNPADPLGADGAQRGCQPRHAAPAASSTTEATSEASAEAPQGGDSLRASEAASWGEAGERWSFDPLTALVLSVAIVLVSAWFMWSAGAAEPDGARTSTSSVAASPTADTADTVAFGEAGEGVGERGFKLRPDHSPGTPSTPEETKQGQIVVHVAGAVHQPGVVTLPGDARAYQALEAAGGPRPEADTSAVNLAGRLHDGDYLYLPQEGEAPSPAHGAAASASTQTGSAGATQDAVCVDINSASAEELDHLPGVGPALSQRIVEHRNANGPFARIEDLDAVSGIGIRMINRIRPALCQ